MPRIILHVDMNCYFASVEQQANPFLRGKPIGVTGKRQERSVLATASIEAKKLGAKTAMSTWEAKKICPSIILVAGDPEKYAEITGRFNNIFHDFTNRVEKFSVDESFLDVTDEAGDYLGAVMIAQTIRDRLRTECGERITASIGIGPNKLVAKAASESVKPNGLTAVKPEEVLKFLDGRELQDICGIGPRIAARLANLGILTIKKLRSFPVKLLVDEFKSYGYWLHEAAWGRDNSEVVAEEPPPKSVGHSYTLPRDTSDEREMKSYLLKMADRVAFRLRRDGFKAKCVSAYIRFGDFSAAGQQTTLDQATADGMKLFGAAWVIVNDLLDGRSVRMLGLSVSRLTEGAEQTPIFRKDRKTLALLPALDRIERRFGQQAWTRASLLPVQIKTRASGFCYDHEI